ncbi:MAG: hypothetical protein RLZ98_3783 [Pseudomonadota bacterium]|jgi:Spy/CpxP family protein refolding chaperone
MTEQTTTPTPEAPENRPNACKRRGRFAIFAVALALIAGIAGVAVTKAVSHAGGFGHGFMRGMHGPMDAATANRRAERAMKHLAVEVDATPEQTSKLVAIAQGAVKDLLPIRDQLMAGRGEIKDLLLAANVDKAAIEKMRARSWRSSIRRPAA